MRSLVDIQAQIHAWVERSKSSEAKAINLEILILQTPPTAMTLDGVKISGDEIVKVAKECFEANNILWTGQISL